MSGQRFYAERQAHESRDEYRTRLRQFDARVVRAITPPQDHAPRFSAPDGRASTRIDAGLGAIDGCRGKRRNSPAKVTRRPGLKALAAYGTQYTHLLTPIITMRRDRKGT